MAMMQRKWLNREEALEDARFRDGDYVQVVLSKDEYWVESKETMIRPWEELVYSGHPKDCPTQPHPAVVGGKALGKSLAP